MAANGAAQHAAREQQQLMELLADAHAHPQLDPANMQLVQQLQCCHVAAMSVSYDVDWDIMLQLHQLAGGQAVGAAAFTMHGDCVRLCHTPQQHADLCKTLQQHECRNDPC
jgi:hypothetical protein